MGLATALLLVLCSVCPSLLWAHVSMAKELSYDEALALVKDNIVALGDDAVQKELKEKWFAEEDPKKRTMARSKVLVPHQTKVVAKYGFEESQKGVMLSGQAFGPWNHDPQIHRLNGTV